MDLQPGLTSGKSAALSPRELASDFAARVRTRWRFGIAWAAAVLLYAIAMVISTGFASGNQVMAVLQVASFVGIATIGQTVVMLVGGIDLSVAGVITLSDIMAAIVMNGRPGMALVGAIISLALGLLVGLINGMLITVMRVTPLIATLAMGIGIGGAALLYTGGSPRGSIPDNFTILGQGHIFGFPIAAIVWFGLVILVALALRGTTWGRSIYAVGDNAGAARTAGLPVSVLTISAYCVSGLCAAVAGLLLAAYIGTPSMGIGDLYLLGPIAAAAIGGTLLRGGVGSILGTAGGALFLTILTSLATALHIQEGVGYVIQGVIIVVAMILYPRTET